MTKLQHLGVALDRSDQNRMNEKVFQLQRTNDGVILDNVR